MRYQSYSGLSHETQITHVKITCVFQENAGSGPVPEAYIVCWILNTCVTADKFASGRIDSSCMGPTSAPIAPVAIYTYLGSAQHHTTRQAFSLGEHIASCSDRLGLRPMHLQATSKIQRANQFISVAHWKSSQGPASVSKAIHVPNEYM